MARNKTDNPADFDSLKIPLLNSTIQKKDPALFQTINQLLDMLRKNNVTIKEIITSSVAAAGGGGGGLGTITGSGTFEVLAMFVTPTEIGDCDSVAVSAALDLLP